MTPTEFSIKWHKRIGGSMIFGHTIRELAADVEKIQAEVWVEAADALSNAPHYGDSLLILARRFRAKAEAKGGGHEGEKV